MKPVIKYLSLTVAPSYVHYYVHYESGRTMCRYWHGRTFSYFLYPFAFLRESRSVLHILQQLCVNGILPMSFDNWVYAVHPQCKFQVNPLNSDIIDITFADSDYELVHDIINY